MLATVGRYLDPWKAHVLRARLVAEGIPATVAGDQHMIADWPLSIALGGAALQVPISCLAQARQIVADYDAGTFQADLVAEHPDAADACPACGGAQVVGSVPFGQRVLVFATFLVATAPFPTRESRLHCTTCGHAWQYRD